MQKPRTLVAGIETEYAFFARDDRGQRLTKVLDEVEAIAASLVPHLQGEERGVFAPCGNLYREEAGGRTHSEVATAEACHPTDAVRLCRAGDLLVQRAAAEYQRRNPHVVEASFSTHAIDYRDRTSWGSHQNHTTTRPNSQLAPELLGFFASSVIIFGGGGLDPFADNIAFTLSTRAMFTERATGGTTSSLRPLIHVDYKQAKHLLAGYFRFHVICFDSLRSQRQLWLRVAVTALVVAVADAGVSFSVAARLEDPTAAHRSFARDVTLRAMSACADGKARRALDLQRIFCTMVERHLDILPAWAPTAVAEWKRALDLLEHLGVDGVGTVFDFGIKYQLYTRYLAERGLTWEDVGRAAQAGSRLDQHTLARVRAELCLADNRFSQLDSEGIFQQLDAAGVLDHRLTDLDEAAIERALTEPPPGTRATARARVIRRYAGTPQASRLRVGWSFIEDTSTGARLDLSDPFDSGAEWKNFRRGKARRRLSVREA